MISEKQTTRKIVGLLLLAATLLSVQPLPAQTLRQEMDKLHGERGVNFVYDAALPVAQPYSGPSLSGMPLDAALQSLFSGTAISFRRQGHYVLLKADDGKKPKPKNAVLQHFTVSGYVSDESGERLLSATIYDLNSCQGTTTTTRQPLRLTADFEADSLSALLPLIEETLGVTLQQGPPHP
ncbi:MAG: STN domain-containing protein [Prevotella sp.]|nr:STN domain-containing protein [Prevotella sp.]